MSLLDPEKILDNARKLTLIVYGFYINTYLAIFFYYDVFGVDLSQTFTEIKNELAEVALFFRVAAPKSAEYFAIGAKRSFTVEQVGEKLHSPVTLEVEGLVVNKNAERGALHDKRYLDLFDRETQILEFPNNILLADGFFQESAWVSAVRLEAVFGVTGNENDVGVPAQMPYLFSSVDAVHARHFDIQEDYLDLIGKHIECLVHIACGHMCA